MQLSRVALAAVALATILATAPAEAAKRRSVDRHVAPAFDVGAVPAYPTAAMPGKSASRAASLALKRSRTGDDSGRGREAIQQPPNGEMAYLPHPTGCPRRAFCACGAAVKVFGKAVRSLWPVAAWRGFPPGSAASGNVAIERGRSHLFVLVSHVSGDDWLVDDFNSGGHRSRRHVRSIGHATIVNPHAHRTAAHGGVNG